MRAPSRYLALLAVAAAAAALPVLRQARAEPAEIPLELPSGKTVTVELMVKPEDRAMGLMFRPSLAADRGLLFVFPNLDFHPFWMKNCKFPIDILWLDERQKVVYVSANTPPCKADPCPVYEPMQRALYVVELNAGQAAREKAGVGSRLEFTLAR
jgi:hypothetical protein